AIYYVVLKACLNRYCRISKITIIQLSILWHRGYYLFSISYLTAAIQSATSSSISFSTKPTAAKVKNKNRTIILPGIG
ncbi:MAG: hypothetical protein PVH85_10650, partial [Desulfobacterales bacterium]